MRAPAYRPAAVRCPASASRACSRSCRHSSNSMIAQSSYQFGRQSVESISIDSALRSVTEGSVTGCRRWWARARASRRSTKTLGAMARSVSVTITASWATVPRREIAERRLAKACVSDALGQRVPATEERDTSRSRRASNASRCWASGAKAAGACSGVRSSNPPSIDILRLFGIVLKIPLLCSLDDTPARLRGTVDCGAAKRYLTIQAAMLSTTDSSIGLFELVLPRPILLLKDFLGDVLEHSVGAETTDLLVALPKDLA